MDLRKKNQSSFVTEVKINQDQNIIFWTCYGEALTPNAKRWKEIEE